MVFAVYYCKMVRFFQTWPTKLWQCLVVLGASVADMAFFINVMPSCCMWTFLKHPRIAMLVIIYPSGLVVEDMPMCGSCVTCYYVFHGWYLQKIHTSAYWCVRKESLCRLISCDVLAELKYCDGFRGLIGSILNFYKKWVKRESPCI